MKKQKVAVVEGVLVVEYPTIGKKFTRDLSDYSDLMRQFAMEHGFKQKFGDAASGKSPSEKYAEVLKIDESLLADEWERTASPDRVPEILAAVERIKKMKPGTLLEKRDQITDEKVKEWSSNLKVKAEIQKARAAKAAEAAKASDEEIDVDLE